MRLAEDRRARVDTLTVALGKVVARRRRAMGYTWRSLGARCGVAGNTIRNVERGARRARVDIMQRIAGGLGMSLSRLMREAERWQRRGDAE